MKRYWDHTDYERSQMTEETVETFFDIELMEEGCAKPVEPSYIEVPEEPEIREKEWFAVKENSYSIMCVVETIEQAQAIIDAKPKRVSSDWSCGDKHQFAETIESSIERLTLKNQGDISASKGILSKIKEAVDANKKESQRYDKECEAMRKCVEGIWSDWREQREKDRDARAVMETFDEYKKLCDGDSEKAEIFLRKAKGDEEVEAAFTWTGEAIAQEFTS